MNWIHVNHKTGKYDIEEEGLLYSMDIRMKELLRHYIRHAVIGPDHPLKSVAAWHNDLSKEERNKIEISNLF